MSLRQIAVTLIPRTRLTAPRSKWKRLKRVLTIAAAVSHPRTYQTHGERMNCGARPIGGRIEKNEPQYGSDDEDDVSMNDQCSRPSWLTGWLP